MQPTVQTECSLQNNKIRLFIFCISHLAFSFLYKENFCQGFFLCGIYFLILCLWTNMCPFWRLHKHKKAISNNTLLCSLAKQSLQYGIISQQNLNVFLSNLCRKAFILLLTHWENQWVHCCPSNQIQRQECIFSALYKSRSCLLSAPQSFAQRKLEVE